MPAAARRTGTTDGAATDPLESSCAPPASSSEVRFLSGGNQQKVVLAKWLATGAAACCIFDEPTRGIDVGAKAGIHDLMRELARGGAAILMISSELPEVIGMSDRIVVMRDGTIAGELPAGSTEEQVIALAAGHEVDEEVTVVEPLREAFAATPIWAALVGVVVVVAGLSSTLDGGTFFASGNLTNILQRSVALGIVAVGQTVAILAGSLDLSVSYLISLASLIGAETMDGRESMLVPAILLTLALGAAVGLANGLVITKLRVNPFIATLGMALILRGYIENNYDRPDGLGARVVEVVRLHAHRPDPRVDLPVRGGGAGRGLALRRTRFGYHVYAVGGDEQVSGLSGLRTHRVVIAAHVICSVCAASRGCSSRAASGRARPGSAPTGATTSSRSPPSSSAGRRSPAAAAGWRAPSLPCWSWPCSTACSTSSRLDPFLKQVVRGVVIIAAVAVYALRRRDRPQVATGTAAA